MLKKMTSVENICLASLQISVLYVYKQKAISRFFYKNQKNIPVTFNPLHDQATPVLAAFKVWPFGVSSVSFVSSVLVSVLSGPFSTH
jgi:hypothetical protein